MRERQALIQQFIDLKIRIARLSPRNGWLSAQASASMPLREMRRLVDDLTEIAEMLEGAR